MAIKYLDLDFLIEVQNLQFVEFQHFHFWSTRLGRHFVG